MKIKDFIPRDGDNLEKITGVEEDRWIKLNKLASATFYATSNIEESAKLADEHFEFKNEKEILAYYYLIGIRMGQNRVISEVVGAKDRAFEMVRNFVVAEHIHAAGNAREFGIKISKLSIVDAIKEALKKVFGNDIEMNIKDMGYGTGNQNPLKKTGFNDIPKGDTKE